MCIRDRFYSTGIIKINSVRSSPISPGDVNNDGALDGTDLDLLSVRIQVESQDPYFDVNGDNLVTVADSHAWLGDFKNTSLGDANLDGEVAFDDFLILGENYGGAGNFSSGDFDFDGFVSFVDFLILADNFDDSTPAESVPEPSGMLSLALLLLVLRLRRNQVRSELA